MAADRNGRTVAIEIKGFSGQSLINDLEKALGQYLLYRSMLTRTDSRRLLYLAVDSTTFAEVFEESIGKILLKDYALLIVVFDLETETIARWIP